MTSVSVNEKAMNFNNRVKVNFDGGDLTSDAGILLYKEFDDAIGLSRAIEENVHIYLSEIGTRFLVSVFGRTYITPYTGIFSVKNPIESRFQHDFFIFYELIVIPCCQYFKETFSPVSNRPPYFPIPTLSLTFQSLLDAALSSPRFR